MVAVGWKFPPSVTNIHAENIRTRDTQLRVTRTKVYETFTLNKALILTIID